MVREELEKIVNAATRECEENFDRHKMTGYTLANMTVVPCVSQEVRVRKVNDWGTDESEDIYIWYSEEGWQKAHMTVQYGAGINKVVDNHVKVITENDVIETVLNLGLFEQIQFVSSLYNILAISKYKEILR